MSALRLLRPSTSKPRSRLFPADDDNSGWKGGWGCSIESSSRPGRLSARPISIGETRCTGGVSPVVRHALPKSIDEPVRPGSAVRRAPHKAACSHASAAAAAADAMVDALRPPKRSEEGRRSWRQCSESSGAMTRAAGDQCSKTKASDARFRDRVQYRPPSSAGRNESTLAADAGGRSRTASPVRVGRQSTR